MQFLPLGFAAVGPLGILGIALCRRRAMELFPLWGFVLVYMVSVVMFFSTARYRAPVLAPLILLGSFAVFHVYDAVRREGLAAAVLPLAVLVPAALFVNLGSRPGESDVNAVSHESLAQAYGRLGDVAHAEENHRAALALDPEYLTSRYNLATLLAKDEQYEAALVELRRASETAPRERRGESVAMTAAVHNQLGIVLNNSDRREEAVLEFQRAIELDPDRAHTQTRRNLAATLVALDRRAEAIDVLGSILEIDPKSTPERARRANLLLLEGRPDEAIVEYETLLSANPRDVETRGVLADVLDRVGRHAEAVAVLRAGADSADLSLLNNLAWKLATGPDPDVRDGRAAIEIASRACPVVSACPPAILDTLAAGHAEVGDFARALDLARAALAKMEIAMRGEHAPELGDHARAVRRHIASYEAGRPFREVASGAP
jgi:Tfp pilus assembly protein PilF